MEFRATDKAYAAGQAFLLAAYAAIYVLDPGPLLIDALRWQSAGLVVSFLGVVLMAAAFVALRSVIQIAPHPREGGRLITAGVYGYLRHPMYTAIVLIVCGLFLAKPTVLTALAGAVVTAFLALKTSFEESLLARSYPDYAAYKRRTFGLIPIVRG